MALMRNRQDRGRRKTCEGDAAYGGVNFVLLALMRNRQERGRRKTFEGDGAYAGVNFVLLSKRFHGIDNKIFEAVIIEKKTREKKKM